MLRADVKMAYAELSTVRAQADVVRQVRAVLEQIVDGLQRRCSPWERGVQPDVLRGQVEFQKMREMLLMLENRERRSLDPPQHARRRFPRRRRFLRSSSLAEFPPRIRPVEELRSIYRSKTARRGKAIEARIRKGDRRWCTRSTRAGRTSRSPPPTCSGTRCLDGTKRPDMFSAMVSMTLPDLEEREDRAGDPCDDGREGNGGPRRGDPG